MVSGTASFSTVGSTLTVTNSPSAIINWQGFSIGSSEATRFVQQSAASAVLNRVVGRDPSAILGTLWSNGRVFLVNPNGILFGQGSRVDVAGLVASTLNITDSDFLGGRLNFQSGAIANSLVNQGEIHSATGGHIYLVAPDVTNSGLISSPKGEVVLAAGKSVSLVDIGTPNLKVEISAPDNEARNLGQIVAESGRIGVYAGLINQQGIVRADSVSKDATGKIVFRASDTAILESSSVTSASGTTGGEISVLAGNTVRVAGRLDASAPNGGDGGFIETSAQHVYVDPAAVITTAAPYGKSGTWLIDPNDYTIASSGGDITGATLSSNLGSTNVIITSDQGATLGSGDIFVQDTVSWSNANSLTLLAHRNVRVNSPITNGGSGSITMVAGWIGPSTGDFSVTNGTGDLSITRNVQTVGSLSLIAGNNIFILPSGGGDVTVAASGAMSISGNDLTIVGGNAEKVIVNVGGLLDAQLRGAFRLAGGSNDGATNFSGTSDRSASIQANAVNINAAGSITVAGGEAKASAQSGATVSVNASASISAITSITMNGADVTIRGGNTTKAVAGVSSGANTGVNSATATANATLTAGTNIDITGTNITIRGGEGTNLRATAQRNGYGVSGVNTGAATANADASLTASGDISLAATSALVIRGGDGGVAQAYSNGANGGAGSGTATLNASATLSAASISLSGASVTVRGGDPFFFSFQLIGASANACCNGSGAAGGNGTGQATVNMNATLTATNDITIGTVGTPIGSLTVRGGTGISASAYDNGRSTGNGNGTATVNSRALLMAGRDIGVNATGAVLIAGGNNAFASACCNGSNGGQGTGNATVNVDAEVSAGRNVSITASSLTVSGGSNNNASACCNGEAGGINGSGSALINGRAKLAATQDITLDISGAVEIRGGDSVSASACCNGSFGGGVGVGTATVNADARVTAGRDLAILNATSLTVRGGTPGSAYACCNGEAGGANGSGTATVDVSALVSAGQNMTLSVSGPISIQGGSAYASACCNGESGGLPGPGKGTATASANATVSAVGNLTVLNATSLTVRGGDFSTASACCNGSSAGVNGIGSATVNANALLHAGQDMSLTVTALPGTITIRGANSASASACCNGRNAGAGSGVAIVNADATVSAGRNLTLSAKSLTVQGGNSGTASASDNGRNGGVNGRGTATLNANATLSAGQDMTLTVTGGPVEIRGGANMSASATGNGAGSGVGTGTGTATANANATVSAGGSLTLTAGSLLVAGGDGSFAVAENNGSGGNGIGVATTNVNATLSAGTTLTLGSSVTPLGSLTVRGGDTGDARASYVGNNTATLNTKARVIGNDVAITVAGPVTIRGGFDASASASYGNSSAALVRNIATTNASALVHAINDLTLTVNGGNVTVAGGDGMGASGSEAYGLQRATANADAIVSAGRNVTVNVTGGNLTVRGGGVSGNGVFASASASSANADVRADVSAKGMIAAGRDINGNPVSGGNLGITVSGGSVTVHGGDFASASASGGAVTNRMVTTIAADGSVGATGNVSITADSVLIRGGDAAQASAARSGVNSATVTANGTVNAGGTLTINSTGAVIVRGGDNARATGGLFFGSSAGQQNTASVTTNGQISAGGLLTINAASLTVRGGIEGSSLYLAQAFTPGVNTATVIANSSIIGSNGFSYTGGAVTVQGGTARSQGGDAVNTATASANALIQVVGTANMNVTGNFDVIGGSALDNSLFTGGSATATASVVGSTSVTSSGIISVGAVTGIVSGNSSVTPSMTATPSGSIALNADDINIGPNTINVGTGTVTLGTFSATQDLVFESGGPTPSVLSVTPTDLTNITAGTIVLRAGRDLYLNTDFGTSSSPYDRSVELRAGNNAQITTNSVFLADNRSLTIVADNDSSGAGNLNIGGVTLKVGSTTANAGNMSLQGHDINVVVSGGGTGTIEVLGTGNQNLTAGGDITIQNANTVSGNLLVEAVGGQQNITATGGLTVEAGTGTGTHARIVAATGQTIQAKFVDIFGAGTSQAIINNTTSGTQRVITTGMDTDTPFGRGIAVVNSGSGATASLANNGSGLQWITVNNADRVRVHGLGGDASIFSAGDQTIEIQGSGLNRLDLGGPGDVGLSAITGNNQNITVGMSGELGQINLIAGATNLKPAIIKNSSGTQDITTTGSITATGGSATGGTPGTCSDSGACAEIFNASTGQQTITADSISLMGGNTGVGNKGAIFVSGGASLINVGAGGLSLQGGGGTSDNSAVIGGAGANGSTITLNVTGTTTLTGGSSANSSAFIGLGSTGTNETITLFLNPTGDLVLTGGSAGTGSGSAIGAGINTVNATASITINAGANVTLNPGSSSGSRIGHPSASNGPGDISITAAGTIALNSAPGIGSAIRTLGNVTLDAASITEGADSLIIAGGTTTLNGGGISLTSASNDFTGAVSVNNSGANDVAITDANAIVLGTSSVGSGTLTVTAGGAITQTGPIVQAAGAGQASFITTGAGSAITLSNSGNDFTGPVDTDTTGDVTITDANSLIIKGGGIGGGGSPTSFTVNANGTVSQSATFTGTAPAVVVINAGSGPILLNDPANNFSGNTSVAANTTGAVSFVNTNAAGIKLAASSIGGALSLTSGGPITQTGAITVGGTSTINADSNPITLTNSGNDFIGAVGLTGSNVAITDANAITIGASSVSGTFDISATSVLFSGGLSVNNYSFTGGSYTLSTGTYNLGGTTTVAGPATVVASGATINAGGGTINVSGSLDSGTSSLTVGTLNVLSGGTLSGNGTIVGNVNNSAGTVSPGASPGILTVNGNYVQGPSGTLNMEIGGTTAGSQYDQLVVTGTVSLDGTLNTTLINGFVPSVGNTFALIQSGGALTGTFATINQPSGTNFNTFYGPTTFEFSMPGNVLALAGGESNFNYIENALDLLSPLQPRDNVIYYGIVLLRPAPITETTTTTTEDGTVVKKPPACN